MSDARVVGDAPPDGLLDAFWRYERALMADDVPELDALFAAGDLTLRADAAGVLVGHDAIALYRAARGGAPQRVVDEVHVRTLSADSAYVVARTALVSGGSGLQSQLWRRGDDGWVVDAAHVSVAPAASRPPAPAPAAISTAISTGGAAPEPTPSTHPLDPRVWRVVGEPLVRPLGRGPLDGRSVAVKDLFAVAGQPVGAGNATWERTAPLETSHAWAVRALLGAGASVRGVARTDEFAYSLAGTNEHFGAPPNVAAPGRISGGSTSGSTTAVAAGQADVALGTDTGGSVRVPAAYQGLFGIRTSHGAVPRAGLMPLAPDFDTIGWLARDAGLLRDVGRVLLPETSPRPVRALHLVDDLLELAAPDVAAAVRSAAARLGAAATRWDVADELPAWRQAFVVHQSVQAWESHGWWLATRLSSLGADVRSRFEAASLRTPDEATSAARAVADARVRIRDLVADGVVVLPAAPTVAPELGTGLGPVRDATLAVTCVAGLGGLPSVCLPLRTADGLPCAVALVAAPGRDLDLLDLAVELAPGVATVVAEQGNVGETAAP